MSRGTAIDLACERLISPTYADRSVPAARLNLPPPAATTSCWQVRPGRARRCSRGGCQAFFRRSAAMPGARGHANPFRRWRSGSHRHIDRGAALSRPAPQRVGGGDRRRRARPTPGRSEPRPSRRSAARRVPGVPAPVLEALRQPLEDGSISVARATGQATFPARFRLVATMNLCPCGGRADPAAECSCSAPQLARFRAKLSHALLDRFDLVVTMPRPRSRELANGPSESSTCRAAARRRSQRTARYALPRLQR